MTGYCYDIKNKIVLLCYLSIIFVMAHYYCWLLLATVLVLFLLVILDCQGRLSCVPLVSFMNFFSFFSFFNNENYYQCVFILVFIGDQAI